jgi:hypothetical protein
MALPLFALDPSHFVITRTGHGLDPVADSTSIEESDETSFKTGGGTWPSGQRGALASQSSQVQIPAVAVN